MPLLQQRMVWIDVNTLLLVRIPAKQAKFLKRFGPIAIRRIFRAHLFSSTRLSCLKFSLKGKLKRMGEQLYKNDIASLTIRSTPYPSVITHRPSFNDKRFGNAIMPGKSFWIKERPEKAQTETACRHTVTKGA